MKNKKIYIAISLVIIFITGTLMFNHIVSIHEEDIYIQYKVNPLHQVTQKPEFPLGEGQCNYMQGGVLNEVEDLILSRTDLTLFESPTMIIPVSEKTESWYKFFTDMAQKNVNFVDLNIQVGGFTNFGQKQNYKGDFIVENKEKWNSLTDSEKVSFLTLFNSELKEDLEIQLGMKVNLTSIFSFCNNNLLENYVGYASTSTSNGDVEVYFDWTQ